MGRIEIGLDAKNLRNIFICESQPMINLQGKEASNSSIAC